MIKGFFDWLLEPVYDISKRFKTDPQSDVPDFATTLPEGIQELPIVTADKLEASNGAYRPLSFEEYIGQEQAKILIKATIAGTKSLNEKCPHILIYGPKGCGKTTLAKIIAKELGVKYQEIISTSVRHSNQLYEVIYQTEGGVLFFDEVHGISRELGEMMYPVMEDFVFQQEKISPFTMIGATTELGELEKTRAPFVDRFKLQIALEPYSLPEMKVIVKQYIQRRFPTITLEDWVITLIAENCRFTPRRAVALSDATVFMGKDVNKALNCFKILKQGFTAMDLSVLKLIARHEKGIGEQAICAYIGEQADTYRHRIEPYLLRHGLLIRTPRGRKITEEGLSKIEELNNVRT